MMHVARVDVEIPFHDVDVMQVAWHGHYFKYFEIARTVLARSFGIDWDGIKDLGYVMPVVDATCSYRNPLLYGEAYEVVARVRDALSPMFQVEYEIVNKGSGQVHATARTRQVYLHLETREVSFSIPEGVAARIRAKGVLHECRAG